MGSQGVRGRRVGYMAGECIGESYEEIRRLGWRGERTRTATWCGMVTQEWKDLRQRPRKDKTARKHDNCIARSGSRACGRQRIDVGKEVWQAAGVATIAIV